MYMVTWNDHRINGGHESVDVVVKRFVASSCFQMRRTLKPEELAQSATNDDFKAGKNVADGITLLVAS